MQNSVDACSYFFISIDRFPAPVRPEYNLSPATADSGTSAQPSGAVPPRPLQGAAGVVLPRPLTGARPPLASPNRPPLRPPGVLPAGHPGPKSSFEKLILKLQMDFPNHSRYVLLYIFQLLIHIFTVCSPQLLVMGADKLLP